MQDYSTKMPKVKISNWPILKEIDEIRISLNILIGILESYTQNGSWQDQRNIISWLNMADEMLGEAAFRTEYNGEEA